MNVAILIGRLTKDPELKYIPSTGKAVAKFSIAVDRPFSTKDGQKQADFFNIVVWGKMAENCSNYLSKGSLAGVKGPIQNRNYDNQSGEKRYITEIIANEVQFLSKNTYKEYPGSEAEEIFSNKENLSSNNYDDDVPF